MDDTRVHVCYTRTLQQTDIKPTRKATKNYKYKYINRDAMNENIFKL